MLETKINETNSKIMSVNYFAYELLAWDSDRHRVKLSKNPEEILNKIIQGKNLFKIVNGFSKKDIYNFKLKYFVFEKRNEIIINDQTFTSEEGYQENSKFMIPYYNLMDRDYLFREMMNQANGTSKEKYRKAWMKYSSDNLFYSDIKTDEVKPVSSEIIVIKKEQLE